MRVGEVGLVGRKLRRRFGATLVVDYAKECVMHGTHFVRNLYKNLPKPSLGHTVAVVKF